jgi:thioredoxin 1
MRPRGPRAAANTEENPPMASDAVAAVTDDTFKSEVLDSPVPTLVDFWAPWCGPCRAIAPAVEELARQYAGKVKVMKMNVDENPRTPSAYRIMGIPTLLLFQGGTVVEQVVGAVPKSRLEAVLQKVA